MKHDIKTRLENCVKELFDLRAEYYKLRFGHQLSQRIAGPINLPKIQALQEEFGGSLPTSYHQFLTLYGGWSMFLGDASILTVEERQRPAIVLQVRFFLEVMRELLPGGLIGPFVIVAGDSSHYVVYLDRRIKKSREEMEVVEYTYEEGELKRHPDFVTFLESCLEFTRALLESERGLRGASREASPN